MQLLEIYSEVSLTSQNSSYFPIHVWEKINDAKRQMGDLSEKWTWKDSPLRLAGIGTLQTIIDTIAPKRTFAPYVPEGSTR